MFEKASRLKLRFATDVGNITTEDLWDLPLTSHAGTNLDDMARSLSRQLKDEQAQESFVTPRSDKDKVLALKFDLVKHVIDVKLQEREEAENREAKKAQREQILSIIADKQKDELAGKTVEELEALLEK